MSTLLSNLPPLLEYVIPTTTKNKPIVLDYNKNSSYRIAWETKMPYTSGRSRSFGIAHTDHDYIYASVYQRHIVDDGSDTRYYKVMRKDGARSKHGKKHWPNYTPEIGTKYTHHYIANYDNIRGDSRQEIKTIQGSVYWRFDLMDSEEFPMLKICNGYTPDNIFSPIIKGDYLYLTCQTTGANSLPIYHSFFFDIASKEYVFSITNASAIEYKEIYTKNKNELFIMFSSGQLIKVERVG